MAHLLMLHSHPVGYLPPTMASEILYDNNNTVAEKIDENQERFQVVSGVTAADANWSSYYDLPSGFTVNNCVIAGIQYELSSGVWRAGDGATGNAYRFVVEMSGTAFRVYQNDSSAFSKNFKISFYKYT